MDDKPQASANFAVARQPIFRVADVTVFGQELLYRNVGGGNQANVTSDNEATLSVLANGIDAFSQDIPPDQRIFINFPRDILEKGYHRFLDRQRFVLEILETVRCDDALVACLRGIKQAGYVLALDDYVGDPAFDPLLDLAEFVKIDFLALRDDPAKLTALFDRLTAAGKQILAEKVETKADIDLCRTRELPLAQGFFFSRPHIVKAKVLDANQTVKLRLLAEVSRPDLDEKKVRQIIESDVSLTYKLLRYVNAARFFRAQPVKSLEYAVRLLGRNALVSWVAVNLLASLGESPRDRELAFASAVRGRFLAILGQYRPIPCHQPGEGVCLMGLLSLLDAILGLPMAQALKTISIDPQIRLALLGLPSPDLPCLALARDFETGKGEHSDARLRAFGVTREQAAQASREALAWAAEMFREEAAS